MSTFAQKCGEFELNYHRARIRRDNWVAIRIDQVLPRLGGMTPEDFISQYNARQSRKLEFETADVNAGLNKNHGIVLTVAGRKRKVVYVRKLGEM